MKSISQKEIVEFIGLAAIVASLIFVGLQLRQAQRIALAEGISATVLTRSDVANSIKEHTELWRRGAAGQELNEEEAAIFALLLNQLNESFVAGYLYAEQIAGLDAAQGQVIDFAAFLYQNPGARAVWNAREENLATFRGGLGRQSSPNWTSSVRSYLAELDRLRPQFDENVFVDF